MRLNFSVSTSASAKSVFTVKFATRFDRSPSFTSRPPVCNALVPGVKPVPAVVGGKWLKPIRPYGFTIKRRPLPISEIPCSSPAWLILAAPYVRRQPDQRSSSFLRRMKRLKLMPQITSRDRMKFKVEKGMAIVAVHPSLVIRASDVHTPSHPGSPSPRLVSVRCSSVTRASR